MVQIPALLLKWMRPHSAASTPGTSEPCASLEFRGQSPASGNRYRYWNHAYLNTLTPIKGMGVNTES